jgi:hypothetical protein
MAQNLREGCVFLLDSQVPNQIRVGTRLLSSSPSQAYFSVGHSILPRAKNLLDIGGYPKERVLSLLDCCLMFTLCWLCAPYTLSNRECAQIRKWEGTIHG